MSKHRLLPLAAVIPVALVAMGCSDATGGEPTVINTFTASLTAWPTVTTSASGTATFTLFSDNTVGYEITVSDIQNVTGAHVHEGGPGATGPIVVGFFGGLFSGSDVLAEGTFDASDLSGMAFEELITRMGTGTVYVNVHTQDNPGGEIRGQIMQ